VDSIKNGLISQESMLHFLQLFAVVLTMSSKLSCLGDQLKDFYVKSSRVL
jgi:hypothetical protein